MTVREFLTHHDLTAYADAFEAQAVAMSDLGDLTDDELRALAGMSSFSDRKRFKAAVASLGLNDSRSGSLTSGSRATAFPPAALGGGGQSIGSYDLHECIGEGGMGSVYRGRHRAAGMAQRQGGDVAVKVVHQHLLSKGDISERFRREAEALMVLDHPNIVKVHDVVEELGRTAIVMEWVPGRALSAVIGKETGPIPWDRAQAMVEPLLSAVAHAHSRGIVHRDLKPENIVVMPSGEIKLLDFGIARLGESRGRTKTGTGMGTVDYMAPEQFLDAKGVDLRADVYALGLTLYEMLAGRLPWDAADSEFEVMSRKKEGRIPPPTDFYPSIPPWVVSGVMAAIRPSPSERTQSVEALEASLRGEGTSRSRTPTESPAKAVWVKPAAAVTALRVETAQYAVQGDIVVNHGFFGIGRTTEARTVSLPMRVIPACTFTMGSRVGELDRSSDEAPHAVRLTRAYALGTTPVTQELWTLVSGFNPSHFASSPDAPKRPVEQVSWYDAVRFCNALSKKLGLAPAYQFGVGDNPTVSCDFASPGFRLPTEAEWECAARAGTEHRYSGGEELNEVAWVGVNSKKATHPVGGKRANAWGLHDMSGNVWEWTSDRYGEYSGNSVDPEGVSSGTNRVLRGGSWDVGASFARVALRKSYGPNDLGVDLGFRVARTVV